MEGVRYTYGDHLRYGGGALTVYTDKYSAAGDIFADKYSLQGDSYDYKYIYPLFLYGGEDGERYLYGEHLRYGGREPTVYTGKYPLY
jgi:hypothetical protein